MKLSDFRGVMKSATLSVLSVENPHSDYYTVKLAVDDDTTWKPGEHGIFTLPGKSIEGKKWRAFSIASTPEEGFMLIGTRTGEMPSSFKSHFINMKAGEKVNLKGPFGWFTLQDKTTPIVFIAGGVGISPIRALLKSLENANNRKVELVYASGGPYLFEEEIQELMNKDKNMTLQKTATVPETQNATIEMAKKYGNDAFYYISGSMGMINSTKKLLKETGIWGKRMINDPFLGY